ncbi:lipase [Eisenibacter elegans]|jgi:hypothetical protein|uniref:lipase n=1 Tax=Eisenibacter elegans TaxID=997 RepID=UPI00040CC4CA|nr:lipase [Eisenibacter elegans]
MNAKLKPRLVLLLVLFWACQPTQVREVLEDPVKDLQGDVPEQLLTAALEFKAYQQARGASDGEHIGTLQSGLSADFNNWLQANGYGGFDFARYGLSGGSYGGRNYAGEPLGNQPVIFIHGNSDKALGNEAGQTGWTAPIEYFLSQGYKRAELYAITWGPASASQSSNQYHSLAYLMRIRAFIEAVKAYTGAAKVDVVAHSMGVTLARKAIKGGSGNDAAAGGSYNLGARLTYIDTFVGIAGGNRGLANCYNTPLLPTCGATNGFYPGYALGGVGLSQYLSQLNSASGREGDYVYTIWSTQDQLVGYGGVVWGNLTCQIPGQNGEVRFTTIPYGHFNCKDLTGYQQLRMVKFHVTN